MKKRETTGSGRFWTRRKKIAAIVTVALIIIGLLVLASFYVFRYVIITEWASKLGDDSQTAKTIIEYLAPSDADKSASLIALFEIIIAVWVGLNIYNFLGKDELEQLENKEKELGELLEEKTGALNCAVKTAYKNSYNVALASLRNFISLNTAHYATGAYLQKNVAKWMDVVNPKITPDILSSMVNIESFFLSASQANIDGRIPERISIAEAGEAECSSLHQLITDITDDDRNFLNGYIHLRTGDFKFYQGYRIADGKRILNDAIDAYDKTLWDWFPNCRNAEHTSSLSVEDLYCLAYLFNVIGECNNAQRQKPMCPEPSLIAKSKPYNMSIANAKLYFERAIKIVESLRQRVERIPAYFATYYRNLGSIKDFLGSESPIEVYKNALALNPADYLSHQTIATYYLKEMDQAFENNKLDQSYITKIKEEVLPHIDLLVLKRPIHVTGYNLSCWAYTLLSAIYLQSQDMEDYRNSIEKAAYFLGLSKTFANNESLKPNQTRYDGVLRRANEQNHIAETVGQPH